MLFQKLCKTTIFTERMGKMILVSKTYRIWEKVLRKPFLNSLITFVLASLMALTICFPWKVLANPIPIPSLIMPEEYIDIKIYSYDGRLWAEVDGEYPFFNWGYQTTVRMDYPVPPDAAGISVKMDEAPLNWIHSSEIYSTVIGDWPMISWTISQVPLEFNIKTRYEHIIPLVGRNFTALYAMGTGRYLDTYAKETTAYVSIRIEANYTSLSIFTVGDVSGMWTWKPANYTITQEGIVDIITLEVKSQIFSPMIEDLLLTFNVEPWYDLDGDGKVDIKDIAIASKAFGSYPDHPRWNPIADINQDNQIDIRDLACIAANFGKAYP